MDIQLRPKGGSHTGDTNGPLALVFVHGFNSSPSVWNQMTTQLTNDPNQSVPIECLRFEYATSLFPPFSPLRRLPTIDIAAQSLRGYLDTEARRFHKVVLICHSQGGLIVQKFLADMVSGGDGEQLSRIKRVVLFACPNNGAEFALSLRRCILRGHPQEGQLRPLNDYINNTQRRVMRQIVNADGVSPHACYVPFMVFAGESDNLVVPAAAQAVFPSFGTLPDDHFSIVRPHSLQHRSYTALKHEIYLAYHSPPVPPVPSPIPPAPPPPPVILSIGLDGYFIGGDHKVATDAVFALLDTDAAQRRVEIRTPELDENYMYTNPDQYRALMNGIRLYERAILLLLGDGIRYSVKWYLEQIIPSVLELRNYALPGIIGYEYKTWYVWSPSDRNTVVSVRIPTDMESTIRTGYYLDDWSKQGGREEGLPTNAPIWLRQIFPRVVWE